MFQIPLIIEHRCKYLVLIKGKKVEAWCFNGKLTSLTHNLKGCVIIERIGNEKELFNP